jgi:hypothetical protein
VPNHAHTDGARATRSFTNCSAFPDGETRIRTGDTTIFRRWSSHAPLQVAERKRRLVCPDPCEQRDASLQRTVALRGDG